ncbi:LCP family protein [Amycolatopsis regifaucium]|uniref:LytTR family transcriptional regulator n=1 Tax=Amycolatopsis regifaucium TaxID=546365 RepID=A0A154MGT1_9PSEU|nr:LCP family protein [Amycolatopsis regifaucium]KZB83625.1 LytTR family transcriptional regulator [Amycolatopsis regifaucium]OKA03857.1 LytTR family transcriptional regulator [Amycolatopsis regifaucium]SFJ65819.1 cell envelope-related function transcriptional attenuator common domain-containing protein [Amycolatopsis regifaucium]
MLLTSRGRRIGGRVALGLVSTAVLGVTGYAWAQLSRLDGAIVTADVIAPSAQVPAGPAGEPLKVAQNILLVGIDSRTDANGNPLPQNVLDALHAGSGDDGGDTTDTMIVVHIPAGGAAATAISIPRDSYVDLAGGFGKHKINSAYSRGKNAAMNTLRAQGLTGPQLEVKANEAAAKLAIQTIEQFTGLSINHYAAVNLAGFSALSEAVGGVEVCLKEPVQDKFSGAAFPAGKQLLSGPRALAFVRQRHGLPSDLDRIARQQAFLSSMAKTVLDAGTFTDPARLSALVGAIQGSVVLDRGWDVVSFAQQLRGMSSGALKFQTIPVQSLALPTPSDGLAVKVDPAEVKAFVQTTLTSTSVAAVGEPTSGIGIKPVAATSSAAAPPSSTASAPPGMAGCVD